MPRYRANANVLGLTVREEFTSDDPFYEPFATGGFLSVVEDEQPADDPSTLLGVVPPPVPPSEPPTGGDGDDDEPGSAEGGSDLGYGEDPDA